RGFDQRPVDVRPLPAQRRCREPAGVRRGAEDVADLPHAWRARRGVRGSGGPARGHNRTTMTYFRTRALAVFALIILDACGGGGDNSDRLLGFDDPITIRGTAASGRPLTGATVT